MLAELLAKMPIGEGSPTSKRRIKKISNLAEIVLDIAQTIYETVPPNDTIVILGRDLWPVVPILRSWGQPTQYFVWSRLQGSCQQENNRWGYLVPTINPYDKIDRSTQAQWIKEVPPSAWVFDTGYMGSIMNAIRLSDPKTQTNRMRLVCSSGSYLQIPSNAYTISHEEIVRKIEHLEKISPRAQGYSDNGNCRWAKESSSADSGARKGSAHKVIRSNYRLLRECGLSRSHARKYSTFTGTTPRERLDLSASERQIHYRHVSFLRGKYQDHWSRDES